MAIFSKDTDDFIAAMKAAVEEYGEDYVYPEDKKIVFHEGGNPQCQYFDREDPTKPLCLIGVALSKVGVTAEIISGVKPVIKFEIEDGLSLSSNRIMYILGFDDDVIWAARSAQMVQDNGGTWGEALERFESNL